MSNDPQVEAVSSTVTTVKQVTKLKLGKGHLIEMLRAYYPLLMSKVPEGASFEFMPPGDYSGPVAIEFDETMEVTITYEKTTEEKQ